MPQIFFIDTKCFKNGIGKNLWEDTISAGFVLRAAKALVASPCLVVSFYVHRDQVQLCIQLYGFNTQKVQLYTWLYMYDTF